jgi:hypothetical protein
VGMASSLGANFPEAASWAFVMAPDAARMKNNAVDLKIRIDIIVILNCFHKNANSKFHPQSLIVAIAKQCLQLCFSNKKTGGNPRFTHDKMVALLQLTIAIILKNH